MPILCYCLRVLCLSILSYQLINLEYRIIKKIIVTYVLKFSLILLKQKNLFNKIKIKILLRRPNQLHNEQSRLTSVGQSKSQHCMCQQMTLSLFLIISYIKIYISLFLFFSKDIMFVFKISLLFIIYFFDYGEMREVNKKNVNQDVNIIFTSFSCTVKIEEMSTN